MPLQSGLRLYMADPSGYAGAAVAEISQDSAQTNPDSDVYNSDLLAGNGFDKQLWIGVERCQLGANITSTGQTAITLGATRFNNGDDIIFYDGTNSEVMNIVSGAPGPAITVTRPGSFTFLASNTRVYLYRKYTNVVIEAQDAAIWVPGAQPQNFPVPVPGIWGAGDETADPVAVLGLTYPVFRVSLTNPLGSNLHPGLAKSIPFAGPLQWNTGATTFWRRGFIPNLYADNFTGDKFDIQLFVTATEAPV